MYPFAAGLAHHQHSDWTLYTRTIYPLIWRGQIFFHDATCIFHSGADSFFSMLLEPNSGEKVAMLNCSSLVAGRNTPD